MSFAMARYISETIGLITFGILWGVVKLLRLEPLRSIDQNQNPVAQRKMNLYHMLYTFYPYYHLFQSMIYSKKTMAHASLPLDLAQTPILYIYGTAKNVVSEIELFFFLLLLIDLKY